MGGQQTLNIGLPNPDKFSQLGVFSSGWFGPEGASRFESKNQAVLSDPKINDRIKLFWFATGKDDFVLPPRRRRSRCSTSTRSGTYTRRPRGAIRGPTGARI